MSERPDMTGWRLMFHMKLDRPTLTQNQLMRLDRFQRKRHEMELYQLVRAAVREPPRRPLNPARVHIVRGTHGLPPDHGNLVGGAKPLLDVLCCPRGRKEWGWGFIVDDAPQFVSVTYASTSAPPNQGYTEIEIWAPIEPAAQVAA